MRNKRQKNKSIKICNASVHPGEKTTLALPLPQQYSCSSMFMPIKVINGKKAGPCVLIVSTIIGNEFNGLEITNRLFEKFDPESIHGTLITVPVLNVYGLTQYPRSSSNDVAIHNGFPGKIDGNFSERVAYIFTNDILKQADYCVELETGEFNHHLLPQIYCNFKNQTSKNLANAFQAPLITEVEQKNMLRKTAEDLGIVLLVYQGGEAMRFNQDVIQLGLEGIYKILHKVDMLVDFEPEYKDIAPLFSHDEDWIKAPSSGVMHPSITLGQHVSKGTVLGHIRDPFSNAEATLLHSKFEGVIVGVNNSPLIHEGDKTYKLATFVDNKEAEQVIDQWDQDMQQAENGAQNKPALIENQSQSQAKSNK